MAAVFPSSDTAHVDGFPLPRGLFTAPNGSSEIDQYQWSAGATNTVKQDLGYVIVGAGVSTCAPTAPPK